MSTDTNNNNSNNKRRRKVLRPIPLLDGIQEIRNDFEERRSKGVVKYGIEILDDATETIRDGSMTFIIAAPNTGKSLFGLIIATNLAKQGKKVLICSCEMGAGLIMERQLRTLTGASTKDIYDLYIENKDSANTLLDSIIEDEQYKYLNDISIVETGGASIYDILDMLDCFPEYEYIIIDYIQRIRGEGTDYEVISNAAAEIQAYSRGTGKKFVVCSQASRQSNDDAKYGKTQDGGRIKGKGSGSIEEDADVGITLIELFEGNRKKILVTLFKNRYGNLKNITYKYTITPRLTLQLEDKNYVQRNTQKG